MFFLLPEWAKRWKEIFSDHLGLNKQNAIEFMREMHTKLMYLDTGIVPIPEKELKDCAEYCGLPFVVKKISLKELQKSIEETYRMLQNSCFKWKEIKKDPALPVIAMDILGNVLGKADNPGELGEYLTEEIRELTGARCIILNQHFVSKDEKSVRVFSINPLRKKKWACSTSAQELYDYFHKLDGIKLIHTLMK